MKTFCAFTVIAIGLSASLQAASPAAAADAPGLAAQTIATQPIKASHAKPNYWLGNDINRLALLLPSHKAGDTDRR